MKKKIIVAGGGHGGLATAAMLARNGMDVTVYEKNSRDGMGYDWTDIFAPASLVSAGLAMPDSSLFEYKTDMTFYSTDEKTPIYQDVPEEELEIKMERRDIYNMLIENAVKHGVKFVYSCNIEGPVVKDNRVVGIKTDKGEIYGDLVIDACGCESPVRRNLPSEWGVQVSPAANEKFYVYRAFYNKVEGAPYKDKYKIIMLPEGKLGIGWVAVEEEYTDLLIGRFEPFDMAEAERTAAAYRENNPALGTERVRGGQFVQIPVRQPLSIIVGNGYAAIGDSAFMTVPIIGSGIANSFKAAPLLAEVILNNSHTDYTAENLWDYQVKFFKTLGAGLAPLASVKMLLTQISPDMLNYIFEKGILTSNEMTITAESTGLSGMLHFSPDLPERAVAIVKNKELTKKLLGVAADIAKITVICAQMPAKYNEADVLEWSRKYNAAFTK